ncbi:MAG: DUF362 domain-containing protein [Desulfarculus sp.]|jgi:uncharacterized Fe-S center protein|nr:MAG: DUF362 domain-containing protein [Desulfarculus sp.]
MDKAKVWFMNARASRFLESTAIKGRQLLEHSGWLEGLAPGDIVAVKTHMGEAYNVGYLRPVIVRTLVEALKARGCRPFVTDTTTMPYHPWISRTLALDHLETANFNGFNQASMGCPVVIADGWLGTDDLTVELGGRGSYLHKQFVARAIADADAVLSVAHFKGHPAGGYGGAIKNLGVGCASKRGKMNLHGALAGDKPVIAPDKCLKRQCEWWQTCQDCCPEGAIEVSESELKVDLAACVYCFACANLCVNMAGVGAIQRFDHLPALGRRIADSALAVCRTKGPGKVFCLNYAIDVTPSCDCYGWSDTPIVNGVGVLASADPVAVDKACMDLVNQAPGLTNSEAEDHGALAPGAHKLNIIKGKDTEPQMQGGAANGLGTDQYELIPVAQDRGQGAIATFYPEVRARKLKAMYARQHPLAGLDAASFGRATEAMANPIPPKK